MILSSISPKGISEESSVVDLLLADSGETPKAGEAGGSSTYMSRMTR